MFAAIVAPPAVHAPAKACADYNPVNLHISWTTVALSPDCRWQLVSLGDDDIAKGSAALDTWHLPHSLAAARNRAFVIERATGKVAYSFEMERSASAHWLRDNRTLVVNYFAGSDATLPLMFPLSPGPLRAPVDLAKLVAPSVIEKLPIADRRPVGVNRKIYHYYVNFVEDAGDRLIVSADPEFTLKGDTGPGGGRCYIYSVSKTTLRYRFVRADDDETCPHNADEKWD